jgi:hypothetical protein
MALPVKTNQRRHDWGAARESNMETNTVTTTTTTADAFGDFALKLIALGVKPTQIQLESVLAEKTLQDIIALDNAGVRLSGSAERALAAHINMTVPIMEDAEECQHWSQCDHRDKDALAKALAPVKAVCFAAWKEHSNPSTKWARVRAYGWELANPKITGEISEGEGEGEGEGATGGATSRTRDLYQRTVTELAKLYRALNSAENDAVIKAHARGEELQGALLHITNALGALNAPLEDEELVTFVKTL